MHGTKLHPSYAAQSCHSFRWMLFLAVTLLGSNRGFALTFPALGTIDTMVGSGNGDGGPAASAVIDPRGISVCSNPAGIFIADGQNNRVRKIDPSTGIVSTFAGTGQACASPTAACGDGGNALAAALSFPTDVVCRNGDVFVADTNDHRVRRISNGTITTYAGTGTIGGDGDNGPASRATLWEPRGLAVDGQGNLYIAEFSGSRVRKVNPSGTITRFAGTGSWGSSGDGGLAVDALLANPTGIVVDGAGNVFIADYNNSRIRRVDTAGTISALAGDGYQGFSGDNGPASGSRFKLPYRLALDSQGNLLINDTGNLRVRRILATQGLVTPMGTISTIAGIGTVGSAGDGASAALARIYYPNGLAVDANNAVYIGQTTNNVPSTDNRVRKVTSGIITTFAGGDNGDQGPPINAIISPFGIAVDPNPTTSPPDFYIADGNANRIRHVDVAGGFIETIAGDGSACATSTTACGDGGLATKASLRSPLAVEMDTAGNVWIADTLNNRVRKVDTSGIITTFAGTGTFGSTGENVDALTATLSYPYSVRVDSAGNVLIVDFGGNKIRKVTPNRIITTIVGNGNWGYTGDDGGAPTASSLASPTDIAIGPDGLLYIADYNNHVVRRIRNGAIERFAGTHSQGYNGDGQSALSTQLNYPFRLAFDSVGNLYIADAQNLRIRRVSVTDGTMSTITGTGVSSLTGDGGDASLANILRPTGLAVDPLGHIYVGQADGARMRAVSLRISAPPSTPTRTNTGTPTPTRTASQTPTLTPTPSRTATSTSTPTFTGTSTRTPTVTPTPTSTIPPTQTATPTLSPTPSPFNPGGNLSVVGNVEYFSNQSTVSNASIKVSTTSQAGVPLSLTESTDTRGSFACLGLTTSNWNLSANKSDDVSSITALDAVFALQAAVGMIDRSTISTEQMLACDSNASGSISAIDASLILQLRVGLIAHLPAATACGSDWLFNPAAYDAGMLTRPTLQSGRCTLGATDFKPLTGSLVGQDFSAVLLGDCDGSWTPPGGAVSRKVEQANRGHLGTARRRSGSLVIPVVVGGDTAFHSVELQLAVDTQHLGTPRLRRKDSARSTMIAMNATDGTVRIALASAATLSPGTLFDLVFPEVSAAPHRNAVRLRQMTVE